MGPDGTSDIRITSSELPALLGAAENASRASKRNYHVWTGVDLSLLIVGTLLLSVEVSVDTQRSLAGLGAAMCFIVSWFSTLMILKGQYDKTWYGARAIAETVKSLSWRYMMCAEPFSGKMSAEAADEGLIAKLMSMLSERKELFWLLDSDLGAKSEITQSMRRARSLDLEARKAMYLEQRIGDQRKWYSDNARRNKKNALRWLNAVMAAQLLAIVFALLIVFRPQFISAVAHINWAPVFSSMAIAALAWLQLKQHHELAQAYNVAAHELGLIAEQISYVKAEEDLCRFVTESESSISREHTMWMAKRERFS